MVDTDSTKLECHLVVRVFSPPPASLEASLLVVLCLETTETLAALQNSVAATDHRRGNLAVGLEARTRISDGPWSDSSRMLPDDSMNFASLSSSFATAKDS